MPHSPEEHCRMLRVSVRATYDAIKEVYCPILKKNIVFNAKGFHHLLYKPDGTARDAAEVIHKLVLVPLAAAVVRNAIGIHEDRQITLSASRKKGAKKVKATQYALVATVGRKNPIEVRVIILEIENSQNPIFWSIMKH